MSLLGNIIWLVFGGFITGIVYIIGGITTCTSIIGIPFGWQSIKLGFAIFAPFGKEIIITEDANSTLVQILNLIWLVIFGWPLALNHLFWAVILGITIVGIPFARQHLKLITLSLFPFGRDLR
ncbi:MAG: YccF domain-containing protein [Prochloraceae cyanobacterium]|nr:YccF domain-containing protein [Prochloraceae cyanobacterium]